jgi:hypothetical protein
VVFDKQGKTIDGVVAIILQRKNNNKYYKENRTIHKTNNILEMRETNILLVYVLSSSPKQTTQSEIFQLGVISLQSCCCYSYRVTQKKHGQNDITIISTCTGWKIQGNITLENRLAGILCKYDTARVIIYSMEGTNKRVKCDLWIQVVAFVRLTS